MRTNFTAAKDCRKFLSEAQRRVASPDERTKEHWRCLSAADNEERLRLNGPRVTQKLELDYWRYLSAATNIGG